MDIEFDFEILQQSLLEVANERLLGKDATFIEGWLEGVSFTCMIMHGIVTRRTNIENFNSLLYLNDEIH